MPVPTLRPLRLLLAAALAALAVLSLAGCGGAKTDERKFIAQGKADALERTLGQVEGDLADGKCNAARDEVVRLRSQVSKLPARTDGRLVTNMTQWVDHLDERVASDCAKPTAPAKPKEKKTPTPTPTPRETATPEPTATATPTATPVPTTTATPVPTASPTSPVEPPSSGGGAPSPAENGVQP